MPARDARTVVVCIGNELIADDAAGYEVYRRLGRLDARVEYCGVGGIDLLALLRGEKTLIVVDAVQLGAPAGTVHTLSWEELPSATSAVSAHGLGLREAVEIGRLLYPDAMPERIILVGIEGRCFNRTREHMTPEVRGAIEEAAATVARLVAEPGETMQGGIDGEVESVCSR